MAVTYDSAGTPAARGGNNIGAGGLTMPIPAGANGQMLVAVMEVRPSTVTFNADPSGWTKIVDDAGGTGVFGADTGPARVGIFVRERDGTEGTDVVPTTGNASAMTFLGAVLAYNKDGAATWVTPFGTSGQDATHATGWSATGGSITTAAGDRVIAAAAASGDVVDVWSSDSITQAGATLGATAVRVNGTTGLQNDAEINICDAPVTAGATGAPTYSASTTGAASGVTGFLVLRESAPSSTAVTPDDATHGHAAEAPTLTQAHELTPAAATQGQAAASPALTQVHAIAAADATQGHAAEQATLGVVTALVAADATQGQSATAPALTQVHELAPDPAAQAQVAGSGALTQTHAVTAADATQGQVAGEPALTQVHAVAPDAAAHGHTAEQPTLGSAGDLVPAAASHVHTADLATLVQQHALTVLAALHAQTVGAPSLTQAHVLVASDATQATSATEPALDQTHGLAADGATHQHAAGSPTLTLGGQFVARPASGAVSRPGAGFVARPASALVARP